MGEIIEVGDTVRGYSCGGTVAEVRGDTIRMKWDGAMCEGKMFHAMDGFTLVRKARKERKKEEPKMANTYPVVMVRHNKEANCFTKKFLFRVPGGVMLSLNDKVLCDTSRGEAEGWIDGPVYQASDELMPLVCQGTGARLPLRSIIGKYNESVTRFDAPKVETPEPQYKVGDWFRVVKRTVYHNEGFGVGSVHQIKSVDTGNMPVGVKSTRGMEYFKLDEIEPCAAPEPVVPSDTQLAEIKAKYGNGGDVLMPIGGRNVAI